ncbi:MAG: hypothetical protein ACRC13_10530 [Tannerellaceae bacterium]
MNFKLKSILSIALSTLCIALVFVACSKEEVVDITTTYRIGFTELQTSDLKELKDIANAYKTAIGVTTDEFELEGKTSDNDQKVKTACSIAESELRAKTIKGKYTLQVSRGSIILHTAQYGTN